MDLRNKINFKKTFKKIKIYSIIMKYILITKVENSEPIKKEYSSLRKIAQDLETTYCSCYSNFLDSVEPDRKPSKKLSQIMFNKKYKIEVA
jgi:hypothetical protein